MAVGDNTTDSVLWFPGEATGKKPGGQSVSPPQIEVTPTIIGPYIVNFDDEGVGSEEIIVSDLPPNLIILNAWFIPTEAWDGPGSGDFFIGVKTGSTTVTVASYETASTSAPLGEPDVTGGDGTMTKIVGLTESNSQLTFYAYPETGSFTSGTAEIYLLTALLS